MFVFFTVHTCYILCQTYIPTTICVNTVLKNSSSDIQLYKIYNYKFYAYSETFLCIIRAFNRVNLIVYVIFRVYNL